MTLPFSPDQHQIALPPHQLTHQSEFGPVAQLIGRLKVQG